MHKNKTDYHNYYFKKITDNEDTTNDRGGNRKQTFIVRSKLKRMEEKELYLYFRVRPISPSAKSTSLCE